MYIFSQTLHICAKSTDYYLLELKSPTLFHSLIDEMVTSYFFFNLEYNFTFVIQNFYMLKFNKKIDLTHSIIRQIYHVMLG